MYIKSFGWCLCLWAVISTAAMASESCESASCSHVCSCCRACPATCKVKVCRVTETTEKVSKTKYSCECEDFCIPGKSTFCGYVCECTPCCEEKCTKKWKPGCGEVRTRLILKKSTEDEEVVAYKWEVIEVCQSCANHCGGGVHGHRGGATGCGCPATECATTDCAVDRSGTTPCAPSTQPQPVTLNPVIEAPTPAPVPTETTRVTPVSFLKRLGIGQRAAK